MFSWLPRTLLARKRFKSRAWLYLYGPSTGQKLHWLLHSDVRGELTDSNNTGIMYEFALKEGSAG